MERPAPTYRQIARRPRLVGSRRAADVILLLLLSQALGAQQLRLDISSTIVEVGTQFQVTLSSAGPVPIEITPPDYPAEIEFLGGPYIDRGPQAISYSFLLRPTESGRLILPPYRASIRGRTVETPSRLIEVHEPGRPNRIPYSVSWSLPSERLYVGQTVAVSLDVTDVELFFPDSISLSPPIGAIFNEVQGLGDVTLQTIDTVELVRFPIATFLITVSSAGTLRLPATIVQGAGFRRRAAPLQIEVVDLPAGLEPTAAVGMFDFETRVDAEELLEGQSTFLTMRIEGRGNMAFLQFPVVVGTGLVATRQDEQSALVPTTHGYEGHRTQLLRLTPTQTGIVSARVASFQWYDVEADRVGIVPAQTFSLQVHPVGAIESGRFPVAPPILDLQQVRRLQPLLLHRRVYSYLLLLPPLAMLLLLPFKRRTLQLSSLIALPVAILLAATLPDDFPEDRFAAGLSAYNSGEFMSAAEQFASVADVVPDSPGVLYNHGVTRFLAGEEALGLFLVREALRLQPLFGQARLTLQWMEERLGVSGPSARRLSADLFFIALLGAFYSIAALVFFLPPTPGKRAIFVILLVFGALSLLTAGGGLWSALARRAKKTIVIGPEAAILLRIPDPKALPWLELPAGTTVRGIISYKDFYHIRTARGIEGWIADRTLIRQRSR